MRKGRGWGVAGGEGVDAGVELTPRSTLGLNPQERKTCQQVNYLICPRRHAFPLNYCLRGPGRCQGNQILQGHIWHIMEANGKLEDIINWKSCYADVKDSLPQVSLYEFTHRAAPVVQNHFSNPRRTSLDAAEKEREKKKLAKLLMPHLDNTTVHHGVQPLYVRLDWRLLLQQTVKLLVHC